MTNRVGFITLALLCILPKGFLAQSDPPAYPAREPDAIALLERSLSALGGTATPSQILDCVAAGTVTRLDDDARSFEWKDIFGTDAVTSSIELTYNGSATGFTTSKVASASVGLDEPAAIPWYAYLSNPPFHLPGILIYRSLTDERYSIRSCGANCVETTLEADDVSRVMTKQRWLFNEESALPVSLEYKIPDPRFPDYSDVVQVTFDDFRSVSGTLVPYRINQSEAGRFLAVVTLESVSFNQGLVIDPVTGAPQ